MPFARFNVTVIARSIGFLMIAGLMAATIFHVHNAVVATSAELPKAATRGLEISEQLRRCQHLGMEATNDAACQAAWAENRRWFFDDRGQERSSRP